MAILNRIQQRSAPGRMLLAAFYFILVFGAVWMVYPFLLMLSGSMKSEVDSREMDILPRYLFSDAALFRKFSQDRYGKVDLATAMTRARDEAGNRYYSFGDIAPPPPPPPRELHDWQSFLGKARPEWPDYYFSMGHAYGHRTVTEVGFKFSHAIRTAFPEVSTKDALAPIVPEEWNNRYYQLPKGPYAGVYRNLRESLPARYFYPVSIEGIYAVKIIGINYGTDACAVERLNREWGTNYRSTLDVRLSPTMPENQAEQASWSDFVRHYLSSRFLSLDASQLSAYQSYLANKYEDIAALNRVYDTPFDSWVDIPFPSGNAASSAFGDADEFIRSSADLAGLTIHSPDFEWRTVLQAKYGNLAALNEAWGSDYSSFDEVMMPTLAHDYLIMRENRAAIVTDFLTRNYRFAWEQIVSNGHGLRNTIIFCLLNVITALIVNPLAAYALSRFQPRWGQSALFILMATMAFPGEVTQIPSFLLLRDLNMLNTFAALVIPAAANGYSIFLLKGFFDSLPSELYEAATIDGCGELRTFFSITMPLSAPILAVVALSAFTAAYGSFMFALLVCQDESMWTLMVYIYQMQQDYNPPVVFAALVIAAIPTLLVFTLCQNVIMKGIVVPVEK